MKIRQKALWLCFAAPLALAGCATSRSATSLPDRLELGRDTSSEPCQANRSFTSSALTGATDVAYAINCRGVSASRSFGTVSAVRLSAAQAARPETCGAATTVQLEGVGPVQASRCFDKELGLPTVQITMEREGLLYRGSGVATVLAPMERAFRTIAGFTAPNDQTNLLATASIRADALAAAPAPGESSAGVSAQSDADITLRQGLLLNRQGLYVEASQLLNDALSRLPRSTSPSVRAEIALEAGLADSNVRVREAAAVHFAEANRILKENPNIDRASFLEQKRSIYHALDALNRRDWAAALTALASVRSASPLEDPAVLAEINQAVRGARDTSSAVSGASAEQLNQLVIDAQRSWAASVAHLAQRQPDSVGASQRELDRAIRNIRLLLDSSIDPSSVIWLTAQIERQAGRLEARNAAAGQASGFETALGKFDCAIAALQGAAPRNEAACAIALAPEARARLRRGGQNLSGPVLAETQIEQASLFTRAGRSPAEVAGKYDEAIDALIASSRNGVTVPAGLETYLALLGEQAQNDPSGAAAERFFKALQVVGEPATARQLSQLQQIVTADGSTAAKVRDRNELERAITALRYTISETGDPAARAALEAQRAEKERQRLELNAELKSTRYGTTDDRPATVAEVQRALSAGEVYWKLSDVRGQLFGIAISGDQTSVYQVKETGRTVRALAKSVRTSISDGSEKVPFFNVGSSAALFQIIAGPAERQLRQAKALIVDPAGPLNELPAGVLVTDLASVKAYAATRKTAPNDYSKVGFLARQADLQTALSPRSFLISRSLASSTAPKPFIGFGEHSVTPLPRVASAEPIRIGSGCPIGYQELAHVIAQNKPISANKISVAAGALGVPNAPRVTGAAFTDKAVEDMRDIDQYQILHFATHGVPEERIGCVNIPPSLITTLGGQGSDGFLSFDEIARMRLNANLVVLSACETAAGVSSGLARRSGQEEGGQAALSGLVRAFLAANSRAVLATYWKVSAEEESDALFRTFYSAGRTATIRGALKAAQNSLINAPRYSHPFYWGAYFVVGDASKSMLTRS